MQENNNDLNTIKLLEETILDLKNDIEKRNKELKDFNL